ncbi:hypothetical protein BS50DRAFT_636800 [Corynespora cassiicola Philippines]|uniref:Uncharacterized protein n=1 Tax=Corynespora cassiicola Philippines TaxID=1448308 RepID=A0A2T2NHB7_CORCC|nr:hypothetical protein BS50DRAFT_636800 [Corynespora cassiicola Philippines]
MPKLSVLKWRKRVTMLNKLHYDVLQVFFEHIYHCNYDDLVNLSKVCFSLYMLCVPWIYRTVWIKFSKASHQDLLTRLTRSGSQLPSYIRHLFVYQTSETTQKQLQEIGVLLTRVTNLQSLEWFSYRQVSPLILDRLSITSPRTNVKIHAKQTLPKAWDNGAPLNAGFKYTSASSSLITFTYAPGTNQRYPELKKDMVAFLKNTPTLKTLVIDFNRSQPEFTYPKMTHVFRGAKLPRLEALQLFLLPEFFTREELNLWAGPGGWTELKDLALQDMELLTEFIGKVPNLESLSLYPPTEDEDLDFVEQYMSTLSPSLKRTLGKVRNFVYVYPTHNPSPLSRHLIPTPILSHIPRTVRDLDISHAIYLDSLPNLSLKVPTSCELLALASLCPALTSLTLDLAIRPTPHPPGFPTPIFDSLARFPHLAHLSLILHLEDATPQTRAFVSVESCTRAFTYILGRRAPSAPAFLKVAFSVVRLHEEIAGVGAKADVVLWKPQEKNPAYTMFQLSRTSQHGEFLIAAPKAAKDLDITILYYIFTDPDKLKCEHESYEAFIGDLLDDSPAIQERPDIGILLYNSLRMKIELWKKMSPETKIIQDVKTIKDLPEIEKFLNDERNKEAPEWKTPRTSYKILMDDRYSLAKKFYDGPSGPGEAIEIKAAEHMMNKNFDLIYRYPREYKIDIGDLIDNEESLEEAAQKAIKHVGVIIRGHFAHVIRCWKDYQETKLGQKIKELGGVKKLARVLVAGKE